MKCAECPFFGLFEFTMFGGCCGLGFDPKKDENSENESCEYLKSSIDKAFKKFEETLDDLKRSVIIEKEEEELRLKNYEI